MSEENPSYESALHYASHYKFAVFPTQGIKTILSGGRTLSACTCGMVECGSPGKHPATSKGRNSASKDAAVLENLWAGRPNLNVAIATGVESGIFVVDIDGIIGEESLVALQKIHGELPKTLVSITGRGKHYVFRYPARKVFNRTNCLGNGADIRGDGGYIVCPPSKHISGVQYEWEDPNAEISDAPAWLLDLVCAQTKAPVVHEEVLNFDRPEWDSDDVGGMLDYLDPDMGYSDWINVGMALHEGGHSFALWDNWSKRSHKYDQSTIKHWRSFNGGGGITMGTLVDMAKLRGWKPQGYITEKVDYDSHPARDWLISIGAYTPKEAYKTTDITIHSPDEKPSVIQVGVLPLNPLEIDGLIGETVRWICDTAIKPQPELAMLNTMACLGALFGRRYASPVNTRTNVFMIGIAETGAGKDHSRKQLKYLMDAAGYESYLSSDDIKSATGLLTTLGKQPSCVMMIDEYGKFMQGVSGDRAASYKAEIGEMLLKIYSSSGGMYQAGKYADPKTPTQVLRDPNLSIYGTTTLEAYTMAMKRIAVQDGNLNRFIVIPGSDRPVLNDEPKKRDIPDFLLQMWKDLAPPAAGMFDLNNALVTPTVQTVEWSTTKEEVNGVMMSSYDYQKKLLHIEDARLNGSADSTTRSLWARYRENTIKVAMIFAICRRPLDPKITMKDFLDAEKIIISSAEFVTSLAKNFMYENEVERSKKEVLTLIRKGGKRGVGRSSLMRMTNGMRSKDFDDIIKVLIEEEWIMAEAERTATRPKVVYKAI